MSQLTSSQTIHQRIADNIRILSAAMVEKAKSGHPGGAMGGADFMSILFTDYMVYDLENPEWAIRDRFFMDPGHMSPMLYSTLHMLGHFTKDDLMQFRQWGSPTPGHPEIDVKRGIENTSGPLGQGHAFGVGAAIAERFLAHRFGEWMAHKTFIYISDGGIQEEVAQGVGRTAGFLGLGNVIMFYDSNDIQLSSTVDEVTDEDVAMKYQAWGWHVMTIDGNDHAEIRSALDEGIATTGRPTLIIGKTVMGKGAVKEDGESYEKKVNTHGQPLSKAGASFNKTIENLGGNPEDPFGLFPEVASYFESWKAKLEEKADARKQLHKEWAVANPAMDAKFSMFMEGKVPEIDWAAIEQKADAATRNSSATVLKLFADQVENMVVSSADLSESDKTNAFLDKTTTFKKGDFSGAFLQAGVSEMTMGALSVGMALHGGVIPVCATFFVFSDFMKPTLRLAALMKQPVKFFWTHDAFRVGEDGPTHQPIEQEAQLRLLEQLENHDHKSSFLVLRPADAEETTVAWKMAIENTETPTGLIFSRQNIKNLPPKAGMSGYESALQAENGAYIVQDTEGTPDIIFVANGSEVATLIEGAEKLRSEKNCKVRVVSAISEGRFRTQSTEYQEAVLPSGVPTLGMTAGLPVTLRGLVGTHGKVIGMTHFGYSAPYKVLDEKFGYTAEKVFETAVEMLGL
ncbi:MAG: transketolase [Bacteroidota bacterium]